MSKIAVDKENMKLGKIIRIDMLPGKTIKKNIPYVMIVVQKRFQKKLVVPIDAKKVIKIEGIYVWFNITKAEFNEVIKRIKKIKIEREMYTGSIAGKDSSNRIWIGYDPSGLSYKRKKKIKRVFL